MPIETLTIDDEQVHRILSVREGHFADMKAKAVRPAKLTKSMSAFANADGGELYVGIDEDDGVFSWNGFSDEEAANGHLQVFDQLFPLGDGFQYEFLLAPSQPGARPSHLDSARIDDSKGFRWCDLRPARSKFATGDLGSSTEAT